MAGRLTEQSTLLPLGLLLLTPLIFTIAVEALPREGLRPASSRENIAGEQARSAGAIHTLSDSVAGQVQGALAKGDLDSARRLVWEFLQEPGLTADLLLQIGVNLAQHDLYADASQVFGRCARDHPEVF